MRCVVVEEEAIFSKRSGMFKESLICQAKAYKVGGDDFSIFPLPLFPSRQGRGNKRRKS
jgi:hypothetical protein